MSWQTDLILQRLANRNRVVVAEPVVNVVQAEPVMSVIMAGAVEEEDDLPGKEPAAKNTLKDWGAKPVPTGPYDGVADYEEHIKTLPQESQYEPVFEESRGRGKGKGAPVMMRVRDKETGGWKEVQKQRRVEPVKKRDRSYQNEVLNPDAVGPDQEGRLPVDKNVDTKAAVEIVETVYDYINSALVFARGSKENILDKIGDTPQKVVRQRYPSLLELVNLLSTLENHCAREIEVYHRDYKGAVYQHFDRRIKKITPEEADLINSGKSVEQVAPNPEQEEGLNIRPEDTMKEDGDKAYPYDPDEKDPIHLVYRYRVAYHTTRKFLLDAVNYAKSMNLKSLLDLGITKYLAEQRKRFTELWSDWETNVQSEEVPADLWGLK
jgi:hypothetical protein